jgi:hypothetical protein
MVTQDSRVTTQSIYSHRTDRGKKGQGFERKKPPFIAISILFDNFTGDRSAVSVMYSSSSR